MGKRRKREKLKPETIRKAKNFLVFIAPYKGIYSIGFLFLLGSSLVSIAIPYLLGKILGMDPRLSDDNWRWFDIHSLYGVLSIIAVALPIQAVFSFFRVYLFSVVTQNTLHDLRKRAFESLIKSPLSYFDQNKSGELSSRIATDITLIRETLTTTIAEFIRQIITIILALTLVIYTSPRLALMMVLVIPFVALLAVFFGKFIKSLAKQTQDKSAESNNVLEEALMSIKSLKAFTNEFFEAKRYGTAVAEIRKIALKAAVWRGLFIGFILIIMFGSVVFIIWQGIELVKLGTENGGIDRESFFQFIMMTVLLGASVGSVPELLTKIQNSMGATENLMDIINNETEEIEIIEHLEVTNQVKGTLSFKEVKFTYPSRKNVEILKSISFDVNEGEQLAIVGSSGGGKSTIANLILQFYPIDGGEIIFDGVNAKKYTLSELRSQMAYVPQEVILLGGTIKENILYGKPSASNNEVIEAAKQANAFEFISSFPDGFETIVGDRGIQLSGGQRQRIAIARAILRNPVILILDEATSALDSESETLVQNALNKLMKNRTSIVIAHRLSTIKNADKIIVLDHGVIIEQGTHEELTNNKSGHFSKLKSFQE
ncbi:MAG: ABC-type multidrug transport system fused ATPase/permease subunit [Saprospiraceae bacterium]|jgi:ABC-type multidrug transport system fused ATPase/permease subunit